MTPMVLVVGYGNPLRQDDGAGWQVAQRVEALPPSGTDVRVIVCHQLTPELAEPLSASRRAVFIDAGIEGAPGSVESRSIVPASGTPQFGAHRFGPSELLATAQALFGASPAAYLITVNGRDFGYGSELSEPVKDSLDAAAALVVELTHAAEK
ncbi:MAG: hydrogenase maturation protease [Candidatus Hydrogenedentes bacterium]|nr:hydrogenase maturation protease [Candidatus Hydrogenedentota bacterium]